MLHERGQIRTSCNIQKCWPKNLTIFKLEPTTRNILQKDGKRVQHVVPNNVAICCVEMLLSGLYWFVVASEILVKYIFIKWISSQLKFVLAFPSAWSRQSVCAQKKAVIRHRFIHGSVQIFARTNFVPQSSVYMYPCKFCNLLQWCLHGPVQILGPVFVVSLLLSNQAKT